MEIKPGLTEKTERKMEMRKEKLEEGKEMSKRKKDKIKEERKQGGKWENQKKMFLRKFVQNNFQSSA
jgi:hypothetical protein